MVELNIIKTGQLEVKRVMEYELVTQEDLKDVIFIVVQSHNRILALEKDVIIGHMELQNDYMNNEDTILQFSNNVIRYDTYKDILSSKINYIIEDYLLTIQ